jgi:hypothetical protein
MNMMKWKIGMALVLTLTILNTASAVQIELVGQYTKSGGVSIAVSGSYAYIGDNEYVTSCGLTILDISNPASPREIGHYSSINAGDIAVSDDYIYVADLDNMLVVIDVSDPSNPIKIGQYNTSDSATCIAVSDNYVYVSTGSRSRGLNIIDVIDVSDPYNPIKIGEYTDVSPAQIVASEDHVYVADYNIDGLVIIDVSDPSNPQKIAQISGIGCKGVAVSGMYAYLSGYGLYVVGISDPSSPRVVGVITGSFLDQHEVAVGEKYAYVSNEEVGWGVFDISDPCPKVVGGASGGGYALDVAASSNYAYGVSTKGLSIFKVIKTGYITISSSPSGASIYIDGEYKGTTWASKSFSMPVGDHTIKLTKYGYNDWETTKYVYADEYVEVSATLTPEPGSISISSVPAGAKIYLDGEYKGTTPRTLSDVSVGYHTIELNKEDYQSWSTSVYVTSGDTETVSASMSVISVAAPTIIPTKSPIPISTPAPAFTPTPTPISALVDSDGDGVPDKYDYAPYDPNVQGKSDIKTPGFEAIFAIVGLLLGTHFLRRRR